MTDAPKDAPIFDIDIDAFHADPYPALAAMQEQAPVAHVPQLGATLLTRHATIFREEKRVEILSSVQPGGLMTVLMGENMMRKDGEAHMSERRAAFPTFSPRTVVDHWKPAFRASAAALLDRLAPLGQAELVADFAMPLASDALRIITGLTGMTWQQMDAASRGMIGGIANYAGDPAAEARCHAATALIDTHITARMADLATAPDMSLLSVLMQSGMAEPSIRANVKLAISGGQNEPRVSIAGSVWAALAHPGTLDGIAAGRFRWREVFAEYCRLIAPIGMSPRRVAQNAVIDGIRLREGDRVFLMFSAGNRDPRCFAEPARFNPDRNHAGTLTFGAGPHFCAGAPAARALVAEVALPMLFARLPDLRLNGAVDFRGWAFRGADRVPVAWTALA